MSDEARSMWEAFITAPKNATLLKRYANSAKEPAPLFESIGEDLASSNEEIRKTAFWALVTAMPELTNILHERETREPGWRDREGKDQQMVNRGSDILTDLHREFVLEHRFKISGGYGKDPRPYVNKTISNRKKDEEKKRDREVPLDYEAALEIPDSASSVEDGVLENIEFECVEKELLKLKFYRSEEERDLFRTIYIDESPLDEVLKKYGISSEEALRQKISRSRKNFVVVRDELISFLLIMWGEFYKRGKIRRFPEASEWWIDRVKNSVQPGGWLMEKSANGKNPVAVRPLTRALRRAPVHIYLVAVHKAYQHDKPDIDDLIDDIDEDEDIEFFRDDAYFDDHVSEYVHILLNVASKGMHPLHPRNYIYCPLTAYPTAISALNDALAEVRDDYNVLLISDSIPFYPYLFEEALTIAPNDPNIDFDTWAKSKPVSKYPEYRPYLDDDDFGLRLALLHE